MALVQDRFSDLLLHFQDTSQLQRMLTKFECCDSVLGSLPSADTEHRMRTEKIPNKAWSQQLREPEDSQGLERSRSTSPDSQQRLVK